MRTFPVPVVPEYWPGKPQRLNPIPIQFQRAIDADLVEKMVSFIKLALADLNQLNLGRVVVGLSGGLDSVCVLKLCQEALGDHNVSAAIVDLGLETQQRQTVGSVRIARELGVDYRIIKADQLLRLHAGLFDLSGPFSRINVITRSIQGIIFQLADETCAAVASTTDKSEALLGRHTEFFYGHFAPLISLYKSEVIELAKYLGIKEDITGKAPGCEDAWLDSDVLGASYDYIDPILFLLAEKGYSVERISAEFDIDIAWLSRIEQRVALQKIRTTTKSFDPA
jgi:NAD+ synthase